MKISSTPPPLPPGPSRDVFAPLPDARGVIEVLGALLKYPRRIIYELFQSDGRKLMWPLLVIALGGFALYGVVIGTFAFGSQLLITPAKLLLGVTMAFAICFPSLFIFAALDGIDAPPQAIAGVLLAALGVAALLLLGLGPVAWIFAQSTDSVGFVAALHFIFWVTAFGFGARLLREMLRLPADEARDICGSGSRFFFSLAFSSPPRCDRSSTPDGDSFRPGRNSSLPTGLKFCGETPTPGHRRANEISYRGQQW